MNIARRFCLFTIFLVASFYCFAEDAFLLKDRYYVDYYHYFSLGKANAKGRYFNKDTEEYKDFETTNYSSFIDKYGYKTIKIDDRLYKLIDGEKQYVVFPYQDGRIDEETCWWIKDKKQVTKHIDTDELNFEAYSWSTHTQMLMNVSASSTLTDKYHTYHFDNVFYTFDFNSEDGVALWPKQPIPWVEGKKDDGIGEYVKFDIDYGMYEYYLKGIDILNGYVDPFKPHLFYQNNRIKEATIIFDDNAIQKKIKFNDYVEYVFVPVPEGTKTIKIVIDSVYPGTKYRDTCITSIVPDEGYTLDGSH